MKNLLIYQTTEYDCGPITLTNGVRFLFEREIIYPEIIQYIMLYSLDTCNEQGESGKHGTSPIAMMFLCNWLNQFGQIRNFPLFCEFLSGDVVTLSPCNKIMNALQQGSVVLLRLFLDIEHYVLLTGIQDDSIFLFDPYYEETTDVDLDKEYFEEGISFINDQPKRSNRLISIERLNNTGFRYYQMGPLNTRVAVIMSNTQHLK